jgi:hypothetical protein
MRNQTHDSTKKLFPALCFKAAVRIPSSNTVTNLNDAEMVLIDTLFLESIGFVNNGFPLDFKFVIFTQLTGGEIS